MLEQFEQSSREMCAAEKRRAGRPATVSWSHLCLAIMRCFWRGWNAQGEGWRLIGSERLGSFAPVNVSDQASDHRIERAAIPLHWLFEHVSAWLRARLAPFEDRRLASWASAVYAVDASILDQMARVLPWLRVLAEGDTRLLAGQMARVV
jgi:hypothetical protein